MSDTNQVRLLPEPTDRVETGVTQFGDDWPGIFIRGDDCHMYATYLNTAKRALGEDDLIARASIDGLYSLLVSSNVSALREDEKDE